MMTFSFDADQLALDFLNTRRASEAGGTDLLASPGAVVAWLAEASLIGDAEAARLRAGPPVARLLLTEAHRLRDAILEAVTSWTRGAHVPDTALLVLNRVLAARREGHRVEASGAEIRLIDTVELDGLLSPLAGVAVAAGTLLSSADPARVRRCGADGCGLWFLDASKNGSRRWCSMARCGNRAKVAAHHRRKKLQA